MTKKLNTIKIEFLRKTKLLKQIDVAKALGINVNTYGKLVRNGDFRVSQLIKIADFYNVKIGFLFDETDADAVNGDNNNVQNANGKNINLIGHGSTKLAVLEERVKGLEIQLKKQADHSSLEITSKYALHANEKASSQILNKSSDF